MSEALSGGLQIGDERDDGLRHQLAGTHRERDLGLADRHPDLSGEAAQPAAAHPGDDPVDVGFQRQLAPADTQRDCLQRRMTAGADPQIARSWHLDRLTR